MTTGEAKARKPPTREWFCIWWTQTIALSLSFLTDSYLVLCSASAIAITGRSSIHVVTVEGCQPCSRTDIYTFVQGGGTGGALPRPLQNDLQQAIGVHVSDQTVKNRLHETSMRARRPLVGPVLTAQHPAAWLTFTREHPNWQVRLWHPVLFANVGRECSQWACDRHERVWRHLVNVTLPVTSSSMTGCGGGSVMVLWGISFVGRTYLHVIAGRTLTTVRNRDESLGATVGPYIGALGPGFLLATHHATVQMYSSSLAKKPFS